MIWREVAMDIISGVLLIIASVVVLAILVAVPIGIWALLLHWAGVL